MKERHELEVIMDCCKVLSTKTLFQPVQLLEDKFIISLYRLKHKNLFNIN